MDIQGLECISGASGFPCYAAELSDTMYTGNGLLKNVENSRDVRMKEPSVIQTKLYD